MATSQMNGVIQHLRGVLRDGAALTDAQLLDDYISHRDEAAFAALVRRHGPMVWGVCRRVLRGHHAAEDAFQATFLVLVRRAASIATRELLANWLYGVAHQTALKARAIAARRKSHETQVTEMPEPAVPQADKWRDLHSVLDEELSRLPDKYRGVIVLCDLQGKTRKEAAGHLACAEGTVASRLARGRTILAKRLTQRGVALSGGALAAVLAEQAVSAGAPRSVLVSTIKAATLFAGGQAAASGTISIKVAALTEGVIKAMLFTKLKAAIALMLILGLLATGATVLTGRAAMGHMVRDGDKEKAPKDEDPSKMLDGKWTVIAAENFARKSYKAHPLGKTGATILIREGKIFVVDADNKFDPDDKLSFKVDFSQKPRWLDFEIAPGIRSPGIFDVNESILTLCWNENGPDRPTKFAAPVDSSFVLWVLKRVNDKEAEPTPRKKDRPAKDKKEDGVIAWGKEVDGLQLGLALVPADKTIYRPGERIQFAVKARNVSKDALAISYGLPESEPRITNAKGERVDPIMPPFLGIYVVPTEKVLKPGEVITIHEREVELTDVWDGRTPRVKLVSTPLIDVPAGKYKIAFHEIIQGKLVLATGTMEFEVVEKALPLLMEGANK